MKQARDSFGNTQTVGNAALNVLHGIGHQSEAMKAALKSNPGKGVTNLGFGMERLTRHALTLGVPEAGLDAVQQQAKDQYAKGELLCESPIERSMLAALLTGNWDGFDTIAPIVHDSSRDALEMLPAWDLVIVPQMAFLKFRLDFGVIAKWDGRRHIVAVECDGAAFHQDAVRERYRVAYLKSWDVPVFKFSGTLLHEDAIAAADVVIGAICRKKAGFE